MNQSPSSSLPDILARRLIQEQELQIVIVNELLRRKLLERSSIDSHKFVLDRRHIAPSNLSEHTAPGNSKNSVFTGIIGKSVHNVDSVRDSLPPDVFNGNLALSKVKNLEVKRVQRSIKPSIHDQQRRNRLQDMLLAEESISSPSVSCDKKTISPRKERENLTAMIAPRRHVVKLNLGTLIASSAVEHRGSISHRSSLTERYSDNSSRYEIAFASARCAKIEPTSATLDVNPSSFQSSSELDVKASEPSEISQLIDSTTRSVNSQLQFVDSSLGRDPCNIGSFKQDSRRSKTVFSQTPHILGSSVAPGFIRKVHSLRSILAHPVSCHLPTTPEHSKSHCFSHNQFADNHSEFQKDAQDWNVLIKKHDTNILKSTVKTSQD
jgi:hypothetical protein